MRAFLVALVLAVAVAVSAQTSKCLKDPTQPSCASFQLPAATITSDIGQLCNATGGMPNMAGCSVSRICATMTPSQAGPFCGGFSVLKDICLSMGGMNGCQDYKQLCAQGSVVTQCKTPTLPLPSGSQLKTGVMGICSDMWMDGCEKCIDQSTKQWKMCDSFLVYTNLCSQMPDMEQCTVYSSYCDLAATWPLCGGV